MMPISDGLIVVNAEGRRTWIPRSIHGPIACVEETHAGCTVFHGNVRTPTVERFDDVLLAFALSNTSVSSVAAEKRALALDGGPS